MGRKSLLHTAFGSRSRAAIIGIACLVLLTLGVGVSVSTAQAANGTGSITATLVNNDLLQVVGHDFPASSAVTVNVTAGSTSVPVDATTEDDGRFAAIAFLPMNYSGAITVSATGGGVSATATAASSNTGAPMAASPVPEIPVEPQSSPSAPVVKQQASGSTPVMPKKPAAGAPAVQQQSSSGACVSPGGSQMKDLGSAADPGPPWPHTAGKEVVIYFETGKLTPRYAAFTNQAVQIWSKSPCIEAHAAASCPAQVICVTMEESAGDPGGSTVGVTDISDMGNARDSANITIYSAKLTDASDNGALGVVVHEMGHALGLEHRGKMSDIMAASGDDQTNVNPDQVDFDNLAILYGS